MPAQKWKVTLEVDQWRSQERRSVIGQREFTVPASSSKEAEQNARKRLGEQPGNPRFQRVISIQRL